MTHHPHQVHNNTHFQACPCCGASAIGKVGDIQYPKNIQYSSAVVEFTEQPELWECQKCHSWFAQNIVSEAESIRLYSSGGFWVTKDFQSAKPKEVVDFAARLLQPQQKVLDVGCANGAFLDFAQQRGAKTAGLEFSAANRQVLQEKGHDSYGDWSQVTDRFDLITAFDVVEHLYDLNGFLEDCFQRLDDHGVLLIVTGNAQSVSAQKAKEAWWYVRFTEHIIFPALTYFQEHPHFQVIENRTVYSYRFSLFKALKSIVKYVFAAKSFTPSPLLPPDHILICLQKRSSAKEVPAPDRDK